MHPTPTEHARSIPGHPTDIRNPERVARLNNSYLGDFEHTAARVLARWSGNEVVLRDDGSEDGMLDICMRGEGGITGWAEVWTDMDPDDAALRAEIFGRERRIPRVWSEPTLERLWFVWPEGRCKLNALRRPLTEILSQMEKAGQFLEPPNWYKGWVGDHLIRIGQPPDAVDYIVALVGLGIGAIHSQAPSPDQKPGISLYPPAIIGSLDRDWTVFSTWLEGLFSSRRLASHLKKLGQTKSNQRHLFIGLTESSPGDAYFALRDLRTLPAQPTLPSEVTHLWVMHTAGRSRCLAWSAGTGWFDPADSWAS